MATPPAGVILLFPALATAQGERTRIWEAGFNLADYSSLSLSGFAGASMEVESNVGYGISGRYNFSSHFALGIDASWRNPHYRATFVPDGSGPLRIIDASMDVARIHFKGIYYFLESNLTPFIELGCGWTRIDSNLVERPVGAACWWDPLVGFHMPDYVYDLHGNGTVV